MCLSKANGGRRCTGMKGKMTSLNFVSPEATQMYDYFVALAHGKNTDKPSNLEELTASLNPYESMTADERWSAWTAITMGTSPSAALRAMIETGFDKHLPEFVAVKDVPQDAGWHPEGAVGEHIMQAADVAARNATRDGLTGEARTLAVLAALCHDLGKATHTQIRPDGKITSRGHDVAGVSPAKKMLARMGASPEFQGKVGVLVLTHMRHINSPTARSATKLANALAEHGLTLRDWARVANADCGGRGEASQHHIGDGWLVFDRS
jgi:tRNA nucleotidyltransferase (CCA-adding enzyme)